ncbi:periplasmic heavy metal sensor [Rubellimicrobium arenae]|uniref:periplasmic heavy metal sensor n=1 Tax=Rubellimicrobium arenae TaxID=2817372 RepID=UPI001B3059D6
MTRVSPTVPRLTGPFRWLLVASLALNLLVAGIVVGSFFDEDGPGRRPRPVELALGPLARALGEEDRDAILAAVRARPDLQPPRREEQAAAFAEIVAALRADPFAPDRLARALAAQRSRVAEVQDAVQQALVARMAAITPEGRAALADRLEEGLRRHGDRGGPPD